MYKAKLTQMQNDNTNFQLYDITKDGKELEEGIKNEYGRDINRLIVLGRDLSDDFPLFDGYVSFTYDDIDPLGIVRNFKELKN